MLINDIFEDTPGTLLSKNTIIEIDLYAFDIIDAATIPQIPHR